MRGWCVMSSCLVQLKTCRVEVAFDVKSVEAQTSSRSSDGEVRRGVCRLRSTRNEVTSTTDQLYKRTETRARTRGHETTPLRMEGDIEDFARELDNRG
ncbi:hypothetical protein TNCV_1680081 [Trichonephila clavipes]|nr:hypothetical protein TNCV_1680081 [Trichonephila clavipes]